MYANFMDQTYPLPTTYQPQTTFKDTILGAIKLTSFVGSAFLAAFLVVTSATKSIAINLPSFTQSFSSSAPTIATVPLEFITFPDVGKVATPHLNATIIGTSKDIPVTFLVDSGAKISALPTSYVDQVGLNRDTAKRIYLRSATNTTTYGYLADINLKINSTTVNIPIAYADIIEPLLGTYGFFDHFTVIFDNGQNLIIKQKS